MLCHGTVARSTQGQGGENTQMDRMARLLASTTRSERILEIGVGYNPVAPKAAGWRTHVVDHASRDVLQAKDAAASVNVDSIEDVDTIRQERPPARSCATRIARPSRHHHRQPRPGAFAGPDWFPQFSEPHRSSRRPLLNRFPGSALLLRLLQALDDHRRPSGCSCTGPQEAQP